MALGDVTGCSTARSAWLPSHQAALVPGPFPGRVPVSDSEKPQMCFLENSSTACKQALDGHHPGGSATHGGDKGLDVPCG